MASVEWLLAAVHLFTVHMIDGREVQVNPAEVTRLQSGRDPGDPKKQLPDAVKCVIWFTDGTYLSVAESCEIVAIMMQKDL